MAYIVKGFMSDRAMDKVGLMDRAVKGTGILALQSSINALLGTFLFMYMTRILSKNAVGVYGASLLLLTVMSILGRMGLNTAASRFIPHLRGNGRREDASIVARSIFCLSILTASTLSIVLFISSPILSEVLLGSPQHTRLFQIVSLTLFCSILSLIFSAFIQGLQMFTYLAGVLLFSQIAKVAASAIFLTLLLNVEALFLGAIIFNLSIALFSLKPALPLLKYSGGTSSFLRHLHRSLKPLLMFSLPMAGYELASYIYNSVDQYIILNGIGVSALGTYTVALTAANLTLSIIGVPLSTTLTPSFSEVYGRSDTDGVVGSFKVASRYISLLFIPATLGLAVLSPAAISILAGQRYTDAWLPTAIICLGIATSGFSTIINSALIAVGRTGRVMLVMLLSALAGLALTMSLIRPFGIIGAAYARATMYVIFLALSVYFGSKVLPLSFDGRVIIGSVFSSIIMAILTYTVASYYNFNLILTPIYIAIGILIYILALSSMRILTVEDVKFMSRVIPGGKYVYGRLSRVVNGNKSLLRIANKLLNVDGSKE